MHNVLSCKTVELTDSSDHALLICTFAFAKVNKANMQIQAHSPCQPKITKTRSNMQQFRWLSSYYLYTKSILSSNVCLDFCRDESDYSDGYVTDGYANVDIFEYEVEESSSNDAFYSDDSSSGPDVRLNKISRCIPIFHWMLSISRIWWMWWRKHCLAAAAVTRTIL